MLKLEINGHEVEVQTGIRFLKELNKRFTYQVQGIELGFGLRRAMIEMDMGDPTVLIPLIECGTVKSPYRPSADEIEDYLDSIDNHDELIEKFRKELEESNAIKKQLLLIQAETKAAQPKSKKKK